MGDVTGQFDASKISQGQNFFADQSGYLESFSEAWSAPHRELLAAQTEAWLAPHREAMAQLQETWSAPHRELLAAQTEAWLAPHREAMAQLQETWSASHNEAVAQLSKGVWQNLGGSYLKEYSALFREQTLNQMMGGWFTTEAILPGSFSGVGFNASAGTSDVLGQWAEAFSPLTAKMDIWAGENFSLGVAARIAETDEEVRLLTDQTIAAWMEQGLVEPVDSPRVPRDLSYSGLTAEEADYLERSQEESAAATQEWIENSQRVIRVRAGESWVYLTQIELRRKIILAALAVTVLLVVQVTTGIPAWAAFFVPTPESLAQGAVGSVFLMWLFPNEGTREND